MNERCIEWRGSHLVSGYGRIRGRRGARQILAHRWAYEKFYGPIPPGSEIMHHCDNPPCINPLHLRVGTHAENMADAATKGRIRGHNALKIACAHGHSFDEKNTYHYRGERECRECHRLRARARRARCSQ